jgi:hypothetical protein
MSEDNKFIRYDSEKISGVEKHDKGFLTVWGTMSRVGIQEYLKKDGTISRELRLPEEVFNQDSLESFNNIPVTDDHPRVIVTIDNAKEFQRGLTGDKTQKKNDSFTINKMTFTDSGLIGKIEAGKVELSLGYECNLDYQSGVHPLYGKYDAIQRNIRGNHVAVVDMARAGHEARLHLDSCDSNVAIIINKKETIMKTLKIDEKELEVSEEVHDAVTKALSKAKTEKDDAKKKNDELSAEIENLKAKKKVDSNNDALAKAQEDLKAMEDSIPSKAKEYSKVIDTAQSVLEKEEFAKLDSKSAMEIKTEVLKSHCKIDVASKSEDYINARFDALCESLAESKEDDAELGAALSKASSKKKEDDNEDLKAKKTDELYNNWKKKEAK